MPGPPDRPAGRDPRQDAGHDAGQHADGLDARAAERYGRPAPGAPARRRRTLWVVVAVLLAGGVAYAAWFGAASRDQAVARTQGYDVVDDTRTDVVFTVSMPPGSVADCQVEALSSGSAQVGLRTVTVGPSETTATTVSTVLLTSERATTGQPLQCVLR